MNLRSSIPILSMIGIVCLWAVSSCSKISESATGLTPALAKYIAAYPSGMLSKASSIRIRFNDPHTTDELAGQEIKEKYFSFEPAIKGSSYWEDTHTLVFKPEENLPSGKKYRVNLDMKAIIPDIEKEARNFIFDIEVRPQHMNVEINNLAPEDPADYSKVTLQGTLYSSDVLTADEVGPLLSIEGDGADTIQWTHDSNMTAHHFTVENLDRKNAESALKVNWDGSKAGSESKGEVDLSIAPLQEFSLRDAKVVYGDEPYALLSFTDPLLDNQNLNGMISLAGYEGTLRYLIEGNQVRVYPSINLSGVFRLNISDEIKNSKQASLSKQVIFDLEFAEAKPKVRIVGRGNIIPQKDNQIILPIEVIGLNAVDIEIFQIHANNILQYLQTSDFDDSYEMNRVGTIIHHQKVDLGEPGNTSGQLWKRYGVDISEMVKLDPNAFYQVRIGFRPEYFSAVCENDLKSTIEEIKANQESYEYYDSEEYQSFYDDNYYGVYGYYEGYDWEKREDPCFLEYYSRDKFVARVVYPSDLGLIAKQGADDTWTVIATDLHTAKPASGVKLKFYNYQNQVIEEMSTDANGVASIRTNKLPFVVIGEKNGKQAYLKLSESASLQLSRFKVDGVSPKKGLKGFIYGERDVWRPGDSLMLNFIVESTPAQAAEIASIPVKAELIDARGKIYSTTFAKKQSGPVYSIPLVTDPEAETGNWMVRVKIGGATFTKTVKIETIKPNRLRIDFNPGVKTITSTQKSVNGIFKSEWLHGAPAANLRATVEMSVKNIPTTFENYKLYSFSDPARKFFSEPKMVFDQQLSAQGTADALIPIQIASPPPGKLQIDFKSRVFEQGGDFSIDQFSMDYSPFGSYTGVGLPKDRYEQNRIDLNTASNVKFVVVNEAGKPIANRKLNIGLYKVNWRWWWDTYEDYVESFNATDHNAAIESFEVTTNAQGLATLPLEITEWGRYMIRACDAVSGHCSGDFFYSGYPWYENEDLQYDESSILALSSKKNTYKVGETIELNVPAKAGSSILVSLENGSGVISTRWFDATEGDNLLKIEADKSMLPNIYANVMVIQPHEKMSKSLPLRMYGLVPITIEDPLSKLEPVIAMPETLQANQEFTVEVSEKSGRAMNYTVAIVDEGLLDITRFKTPDPHKSFFAKEALGVRTWDLFDRVLGAYVGEAGRLLKIGGDGDIRVEGAPKATRFKPVVLHIGPVNIAKGKKGKHTFKMPNYAGSVRVMVVAAGDKQYGNAQKAVKVQQPLMVLATLPRVIGPGESFNLPVNLFSLEKKVKNAEITVSEASGMATFPQGAKKSVSFNNEAELIATIPVKMKDVSGIAKFRIDVSGSGHKAFYEVEMDVRNPNPIVSERFKKDVPKSGSASVPVELAGILGTNSGILEVSSVPPLNFSTRLSYLLEYPHGCLEQFTSAAFPQLVIGDLIELSERQKNTVQNNIRSVISRLKNHTHSTGGFTYWSGSRDADQWVSNYVGHFIITAQKKGFSVPDQMIRDWTNYQLKLAKNWDPKLSNTGFYGSQSQLDQAYRLYTLALAGEPELGAMNRFKELSAKNTTAQWMLAASYALSGRAQIAKEMVQNLSIQTELYPDAGFTYGSALRDKALILEAAVLSDMSSKAGELARDIATELNSNNWYSTQTTAFALIAMSTYALENQSKAGMKFSYQLGADKAIQAGSTKSFMYIQLTEKELQKGAIKIQNLTDAQLFVNVYVSGRPAVGTEKAANSALQLDITYKDRNGQNLNPSSIVQGTDFVAEIKITNPAGTLKDLENLALTQVFPSGWEIRNSRMENIKDTYNKVPDFQDIRDDRVLTYFPLSRGSFQIVKVHLTAAYAGRYYLPAHSCEAMYDNQVFARNSGQWVEVVKSGGSM
jgi:uncharacterized protein YfaS (alpha-2-macroglobulin family)